MTPYLIKPSGFAETYLTGSQLFTLQNTVSSSHLLYSPSASGIGNTNAPPAPPAPAIAHSWPVTNVLPWQERAFSHSLAEASRTRTLGLLFRNQRGPRPTAHFRFFLQSSVAAAAAKGGHEPSPLL